MTNAKQRILHYVICTLNQQTKMFYDVINTLRATTSVKSYACPARESQTACVCVGRQRWSSSVESIQYNAAIAIMGAICGTSKEKLFQELGLESLQHRRW